MLIIPPYFRLVKCINFSIRTMYQSRESVPVITVPKYLEGRVKKHEKRKRLLLEERSKYLRDRGDQTQPVVTSKFSPKLNHYLNQRYPKGTTIPLASLGWRNGKYKGDVIIFHPHGPNPHFVDSDKYGHDFKATGLDPKIIERLESMGYFKPTQCQLLTIPEILKGLNVICSSETGSGKTMAYLSPIMDKVYKLKQFKDDFHSDRHPFALIVLPSKELVHQIGSQARHFGSLAGIGVAPIVGGTPIALSHTGYDIIVTTLGLIGEHVKRNVYSLKKVTTLVIDEADTMLDDTFSYGVYDLLEDLRFKSSQNRFGTQLCLISATIPQNLENTIGDYVDFDSFERIETKNLHKMMPHVKHVFLRVHKFDRINRLLEIVDHKLQRGRRIVIFTRTRSGCEWMYHHLKESDLNVSHLHKNMEETERITQLRSFNDGHTNILCSTDLGSRGLDLQQVTDVINFDSPHHVSDYIHRAGRTGRVGCGKNCEVTTFTCFRPDVEMLQKLEEAVRLNRPIEGVNGNIRKVLQQVTARKLARIVNKSGTKVV